MQFETGKSFNRLFWQVKKVRKPMTRLQWPLYREQNVVVIKKVEDHGLKRSKTIPWKILAGKQLVFLKKSRVLPTLKRAVS